MGALLKEYVDMSVDNSNVENQDGNVMNIPSLTFLSDNVANRDILFFIQKLLMRGLRALKLPMKLSCCIRTKDRVVL